MAIKRYELTRDCDITNVYTKRFGDSGSLSNDGAADSLQVFSIYNQNGIETSSLLNRKSRILVAPNFDLINEDTNNGIIPQTGKEFWLKLFNVKHHENLPKNFYISVYPVTKFWEEGVGLDQDSYFDKDEANWEYSEAGVAWNTPGGDYESVLYTSASVIILEKSQHFVKGDEDLEINITDQLSNLMDINNQFSSDLSFVIKISDEETNKSVYKKKFSSRSTEYFFKKPVLEVRWNSTIKDDRINSFCSSSLAGEDNINTLYYNNYIRGELKDIPGITSGSNIYVHLYDNINASGSALGIFTGSWISTGSYAVDFFLEQSGTVYDFWRDSSNSNTYFSSSLTLTKFTDPVLNHKISMPNLKQEYSIEETVRFDLLSKKLHNINYYVKFQPNVEPIIIENAYYQIKRVVDNLIVVNYGTGSVQHTQLSFDKNGNYFNFPINLLEQGYMYEISYLFKFGNDYREQNDKFRFRVI